MDIPSTLRKLRLEHDKSQEELGEVLGVKYSTYGKYEQGITKIRLDQAKKIADYYNLSLDEFYNYGKYRSIEKPGVNVVAEDVVQYLKKSDQKVSLIVELDGSKGMENKWISVIQTVNQLIKDRALQI